MTAGSAGSTHQRLADLAAAVSTAVLGVGGITLDRAAGMLLASKRAGRSVFLCGNGGSAGLANHAACDLQKAGLRAVSLASSPEVITAAGNDYGYEYVFAGQLAALARAGDVLVVISSSGQSPSIVKALAWAALHKVQTIALTGFSGGEARGRAEASVHVDAHDYGVVETAHQAILHALAAHVRETY